MKFSEAAGFIFIGTAMLALPQWAPSLCPANGFDGTSGRQLWLQLMGLLQTGLGFSGVAKTAWVLVSEWLETSVTTFAAQREHEISTSAAMVEWPAMESAVDRPAVAFDFAAASRWDERKAA